MRDTKDEMEYPTPPPAFDSAEDVKAWAEAKFPDQFAILPDPTLAAIETFKDSRNREHASYCGFVFTKFTPWMPYHLKGSGAVKVLAAVVSKSIKACEIRNERVARVTPLLSWLKDYGPTFMDVFNGCSEEDHDLIALEIEAIITYYLAAKGQPAIKHSRDQSTFGWNLQRGCERISQQSIMNKPLEEARDAKPDEAAPVANSSRPIDDYQSIMGDRVHRIATDKSAPDWRLDEQSIGGHARPRPSTYDHEQRTKHEDTIADMRDQIVQLTARVESSEANAQTMLKMLNNSIAKCAVLQESQKTVEQNVEVLQRDNRSLKSNLAAREARRSPLDSEVQNLRADHEAQSIKQITRFTTLEERMDKTYSILSQQKRQIGASDVKLRVNQSELMAHIVEIEACTEMLKQELMERDTKDKIASMNWKHAVEIKHHQVELGVELDIWYEYSEY